MTPSDAESAQSIEPIAVAAPPRAAVRADSTAFAILGALSFCHLLNDMIASLVPAIYPIFRNVFQLDYAQIGLITLTYQCTASVFQPLVGLYTDHNPKPYSLPAGMSFTLVGLLLLAQAGSFSTLLIAAALIGVGSAVFHPESSRVARMASGGQHGLAQSLFQVGGNAGSALGPLLAAFIVLPRGQYSISWFSVAALLGIVILAKVGAWYRQNRAAAGKSRAQGREKSSGLPRKMVVRSLAILIALVFSKYVYLASLTSYYTFYLISRFQVPVQNAQIHLLFFWARSRRGR